MNCIPIKFQNTGITNTNVIVSLSWDAALTYDSDLTTTGTFALTGATSGEWTIGTFNENQDVELNLCFTGIEGTYDIAWSFVGDLDNELPSIGTCELVILAEVEVPEDGDSCNPCIPPTASPQDDNCPAITGCVGTNDNIVSQGCQIHYTLVPGSEVNISNINFDSATGCFDLEVVSNTVPWEFDYEVWFTNCPSDCYPEGAEYGPFGPAKKTGEPRVVISCEDIAECDLPETITTIDASLDLSDPLVPTLVITYVNEDGSQLPIEVPLSVLLDDTDTTYTFTETDGVLTISGSDGSSTALDLCAIIQANCPETVTSISYDPNTLSITYTDEEGEDTVLNLSNLISTLVANLNGSYTHTSGDGTVQSIFYLFDVATYLATGVLNLVNGEGTVVSTIDLCNIPCPSIVVSAGNGSIDLDGCDDFCGRIQDYATVSSCDSGPTQYCNVSSVGGDVIIGAGGEFRFKFTDCDPATLDAASFVYEMKCVDGSTSTGQIDFNYVEITPSADAVDDNWATPKNTTLVGSVASNDVLCPSGFTTTFQLNTNSANGNVYIDPATGQFTFVPNFCYIGTTTFTYDILCNGVVMDTAIDTIEIVDASPADDVDIVAYGTTAANLDATDDDLACTGTALTSYQWVDPAHPNAFGTITGTPDNFDYTPSNGFCGVGFTQYELLCDGVVFGTATHYLYVTCAQPVDDYELGALDIPQNETTSNNDFSCVNGGVTTYHLLKDDTVDGVVASAPANETEDCSAGGNPSGTIQPDVTVTNWDQANGDYTLTPVNGWQGTVCFQYFIRCTTPNGVFNSDPATVYFTIEPPVALIDINC